MTKRVHLISLGCPKNRLDSEIMLGVLGEGGHTLVSDPEDADVIVVNTCAFIEAAKKESLETILEMAQYKESGQVERLVVTGCLAQRYGAELQGSLPEVDTFLGTSEFRRIGDAVKGQLPDRTYISEGSYLYSNADARTNTVRGGTAYVKIAEGCNRTCSFCIIPKIRGAQKSRPVDDVYDEIQRLANHGVREAILIAQDLTSYGIDNGSVDKRALVKLLQRLEDVTALEWVRMLYMYPWNFTDELLEIVAGSQKVVPYVDMPLPHISAPILKAMRRNITRDRQVELIRRLREVPGLVLRTTFIAGFPGETDEDFRQLYDWVREVEFDRVGVFTYSIEENTGAGEMENQVEEHVKVERRDALMELQQSISEKKTRALVGQTMRVLVDGVSAEHEYVFEGRHYGQAPDIDGVVYLSYDDGGGFAAPGTMVNVEITEASAYDLVGVVLPDSPLDIGDGSIRLSL